MKKYFLITVIITGLVSCEEYLDKAPNLGFTEEVVFNDFTSIRGYFDKVFDIIDLYLEIQSQAMQRCFKTAELSDECGNIWKTRNGWGDMNKGLWLGRDGIAEFGWNDNNVNVLNGFTIPKAFNGIRICNRVLEKVPEMTILTHDQKNELIGQAYFFRGWFYFEVIRRVGGFPPMDKMFNSDNDGNMERLTYAQSNEYIIDDMDAAIEFLPHRWDETQTGRPTKSSAYALKSMAQLYAASPLMRNGIDRTEYYEDYDAGRVELAAKYAWDCLKYIEENKNMGRYDQTMQPEEQYANIFYFPRAYCVSQEMLWFANSVGERREVSQTALWQCWTMTGRQGANGTPNVCPNQTIIDKFETDKGYSIHLTESGWQCDDPAFDLNEPFKHRDPRLEHFILLPGESFGTRVANTAGLAATEPDVNAFYLCNWEDGNEDNLLGNPEGGRGDILTGYLCKKYQWPQSVNGRQDNNNPGYVLNSFNEIYIRTTQVWLDYAEAMNEAYGPNEKPAGYTYSAVEALNKVRERVGHVPVLNKHTLDKVTFRQKIRDERAVELLFENHRWFDIRRWMILEEVCADPNPIKGITIKFKQGYTSLNYPLLPPGVTFEERENAKYGACFTYTLKNYIPEEVRLYDRRHYWYPMRRDEINRFPIFKQNPGW